MGYYIDLNKISLDDYKRMLITRYLIPSQTILRENIENNFKTIKNAGFLDMGALKDALKTKKKAEDFSKELGIPEKYCVVLRRELNSHHSPARLISDYPTIDEEIKSRLSEMDIINSRQLFDYIISKGGIDDFAESLGIEKQKAMHIAKLMDVTRLRYVSPLFATLLVHSKYDTIEKIKTAEAEAMYDVLIQLNKANRFFKGNIGKNDTLFLIQDTEHVSCDISF